MISGETICPYCGVGCRLDVSGALETSLKVRGVADAPANRGRLCAKGALLGETIVSSDRLTRPLSRQHRQGAFRPADWDTILPSLVQRLKRIHARHGPDSIAFYGSGQLDTETSYLVCKLFKGHLHTNNTDSNSRLCMAGPTHHRPPTLFAAD
jgi:assimilatory nitrate reductase catalytic subunit